MKIYCNFCNKYRKLKNSKISYIFKETLDLSIVYNQVYYEYKKVFKEEGLIEILKVLVLITNIEEYQNL